MKIGLSKKFPKDIFDVIKIVGKEADKKKIHAYLVGGMVRDALLKVPNLDLDFVVEANGIKFAEALNKVLKGDLEVHRAFKTATVIYKDLRIDIVTARSESYKRPASYPDVKPAAIKEDLFRRDFTINAMSISINKKGFGTLIDFYNGLEDLKKGFIRVMHNKSFIDDPTRIYRAVRFSVRFGFKIEPQTRKLMKEAILGGFLGKVNRGRIKKETESFLKEEKPLKCLDAFARLV